MAVVAAHSIGLSGTLPTPSAAFKTASSGFSKWDRISSTNASNDVKWSRTSTNAANDVRLGGMSTTSMNGVRRVRISRTSTELKGAQRREQPQLNASGSKLQGCCGCHSRTTGFTWGKALGEGAAGIPYRASNIKIPGGEKDEIFFRPVWVWRRKRVRRLVSAVTEFKQATATEEPQNFVKEAHKYFDQVVITVCAGYGGNGSVLTMPVADPPPPRRATSSNRYEKGKKPDKGKTKTGALKRSSDGSLVLPMGGHGGDVTLCADEGTETLLELHKKKRYTAKRGGNVNASGPLTPMLRDGSPGSSLAISVPVGTVVKRKKGGKLLADLSSAGDKCLVARGGQGGVCVLELPKQTRKPLKGVDPAVITDPDDKVLTLGGRGEEVVLELTLRVVADVGVVGLPNAGKSSLLAAVTRATPDIADYPFTTLMPNLGRLPGTTENMDGGFAAGATLADLPGLIKGAHLGKGLGRMFLRHLRRTRLLLHVVDTSADDPVRDYEILREELRMYNPDYAKRPHIVVLNKLDLPKASACFEATREIIQSLGSNHGDSDAVSLDKDGATPSQLPLLSNENTSTGSNTLPDASLSQDENLETFFRPVAVVGISAKEGLRMEELLKTINVALERDDVKVKTKPRREARPQLYKTPQWQI